jgi:membrane-associated protease RseP (regulator of RpoE activity)
LETNFSSSSPIPTDDLYKTFQIPKPKERYVLHIVLFLLTLACTIWAGAELATGQALLGGEIKNWGYWISSGLWYAVPFLLFLTTHEFGHYFAARSHGISTTLPFYLPAPLAILGMFSLGTFGAVIRIREVIPSKRKLFDVGAAGPLAGFIVAFGVLLFGLATLPDPSYMAHIPHHEAINAFIKQHGRFPYEGEFHMNEPMMMIGQTLLYKFVSSFFSNVPPMYEMYHYPVLFAGWLGLFFTALNLLPVGQLDGGHIWYTLIGGKKHGVIARVFVVLMLISASVGYMVELAPAFAEEIRGTFAEWDLAGGIQVGHFMAWGFWALLLFGLLNRMFHGNHRFIAPTLLGILAVTFGAVYIGESATQYSYFGWTLWSFLIIRFIGVDHPPVMYKEPLDTRRKVLAVLSILIFILCFSPTPIYMV